MPFYFHRQGSKARIPGSKEKIVSWLSEAIKKENALAGEINYIFCSDDFLLDLNKRFLKHNTLTDIITFDYSSPEKGKIRLSGDIYISTDRVIDNASELGVSKTAELRRVMIHGLLHLCGYKDKSPADKKKMTAKEDFYLEKF